MAQLRQPQRRRLQLPTGRTQRPADGHRTGGFQFRDVQRFRGVPL